MNAIILCGGLATRLGEITKDIPKILLDIKGKTVLEWQLEKLGGAGITEAVLAAGHLNEVLYDRVGRSAAGIALTYAIEEGRLGTGGAIKHAREYLARPEEPTIVLNGDILTAANLTEMLARLRLDSEGLILGVKVDDAATYGTLEIGKNSHLAAFKEKVGKHESAYINGGIYMFTKHAWKFFPPRKSFSIEHDVFPIMKDLDVYCSDRPWADIGLPERLEWAREHWTV